MNTATIGKPLSRVDGRLKVTGAARFTAEWDVPDLRYGWVVGSAIANGRVRSVDTKAALLASGVFAVITPQNAPRLVPLPEKLGANLLRGEGGIAETRLPLQDDLVLYSGQPIAIVVADTLERARHAASLVKVEYETQPPTLSIETASHQTLPMGFLGRKEEAFQVKHGDVATALEGAPVKLERSYETAIQHHNPIELPATVAVWEKRGGKEALTLYETTRHLKGAQSIMANCLGLPLESVRIICPFVGGAFGAKNFQWANPLIAAMAARVVGQPVKIEWQRQQMFSVSGQRSRTLQNIALGATREGKLVVLRHDSQMHSSITSGYTEPCARPTRMLYAVPNLEFSHQLSHLNLPSACPVRAPGEAPGSWALECALDELAYEVGIDPVELRLRNYAEKNPLDGKPWSSKHLRACYARGKTLIGWDKRDPRPRSMRQGNSLVGYGMATTMYPAARSEASARATLFADGRALVQSATHEIGNGAYTIFRQIAAQTLALPLERVRFELGDSNLPSAPGAGGSTTTASVSPAVLKASQDLIAALKRVASRDSASPLFGAGEDAIVAQNGRLVLKSKPQVGQEYSAILRRAKLPSLSVGGTAKPGEERDTYSLYSFGAIFAQVRVDESTGSVRVERIAAVLDVGQVMNPKTARSQFMGGMIWGLGYALMEETIYDPNTGSPVVRNLADYHFPSMADTPEFTVEYLNIPDPHINELGARGIGEIGMVGTPAAITNAVFHATGKRVRKLPLTPDKLI